MKSLLVGLAWLLVLVPARSFPAEVPVPVGHLLLLGGSDEPREFWPRFLELAGGSDAPIVVLPTASERPEAGPEYAAELQQQFGAKSVRWLPIYSQADARDERYVAALRAARGIFFTGGDQAKITRAARSAAT